MKRLFMGIPLLILLIGSGFVIEGSSIPKCESTKTALLVMDMQEDFLGENAKMPIKKEQIPAITAVVNSLIDEFERNGQPIIYIKSEFPKIALGNRIRHHAAIVGSPGTKIYGKIRISGKLIYSKKKPNAFSNPEFEKYLVENQISQLIITGVYADQCVLDTAMGALDRNYQVTFVRNGVGSSSEKAVNKACEKVKKRGAEVIEYQPNGPESI
ncbi:MAG: cysteine hydrolase [Comamonadaceae bacterium]|nr:cysteine hydrolase [Comamonadaceae bacterium]